MGKKHHNHFNQSKQQQQQATEVAPEVPQAEVSKEDAASIVQDLFEAPAQEEVTPAAEPEPVKAPEEAAPVEEPVVVEEPIAPAVPEPEPPKAPAPEPVKPAPVQQPKEAQPQPRRVRGEDVLPSTSPILKARMGIQPRKTTPQGQRLASMMDEYAEMVKTPTQDRDEIKRRVMKLYQIMSFGCPASLRDSIIATDLVRVAFDKLAEGWGTTYKENTMFQLDYTLPGGPAAIDKLNMYWAAMIQLVEGALYKKRIMFDDKRLALVLKSPIICNAISKMKTNILDRNAGAKPA